MSNYRCFFPGVFTMGNIICGFVSILSVFEGNFTTACWLIILAGFLDALDGRVARLSGATSQFGVELDSLADFLSFGVAPAVLVYTIKLSSMGKWGWVISVIFITAASYRLARYNLLADTDEKKDFLGMPVPLAAFGLISYVIFSYRIWGELQYGEVLVSMIIGFAFLMVSQIQYDALPERFSSKCDRVKLAAIIIAVVAVFIDSRLMLFPIVASYILFGLIREAYRLFFLGVGKVSAHSHQRRSTDRREPDGRE
ncbi:MAG: CDP-diacylglycerol--serine O-phosphatidyltransferase [candidate division Zixibacteria bacterium]|nr:CDP-diacylglycerol--serine O-phosphatidyltransferase [candidate division Zixibacteria bacterium]